MSKNNQPNTENKQNNLEELNCEVLDNNTSDKENASFKIIPHCISIPLTYSSNDNDIFMKIPVILSEFDVEIPFITNISLPHTASEIKKIANSIYILESNLVYKANKLFLKGNVKKNIEYISTVSKSKKTCNSVLRHFVTRIPFECTTTIPFFTLPQIDSVPKGKQYEVSKKNANEDTIKEITWEEKLLVNEKINCELLGAKFNDNTVKEKKTFNRIDLTFIVTLTIRLVQNQKIKLKI